MPAKWKIFNWTKETKETSPFYQRLDSEIFITEQLIKRRMEAGKGATDVSKWAQSATTLIERAKESLQRFNLDDGWKALNAARRMEVYAMEEHERNAVATQVINETGKLNKWRANAINDIFKEIPKSDIAAKYPEVLIKALEIRDEHFDNRYLVSKLARNYFGLLFLLLIINLIFIMIWFFVHSGQTLSSFGAGFSVTDYVTGVLLFGFLGAISSSILFLRKTFFKSGNQDMRMLEMILFSKIIISGAFSLFVFFLVQSSLSDDFQLFNFTVTNLVDYLALAFVSGFSERLVNKAIEKFTA